MKKIYLSLFLSFSLFAEEEFTGILTTKECAEQGTFADCYLENYACGKDFCFKKSESGVSKTKLALFEHSTGKIYDIDHSNIKLSEVSAGINKDNVVIIGELKGNTVVAKEFKAPPPPKKSFFKGCL